MEERTCGDCFYLKPPMRPILGGYWVCSAPVPRWIDHVPDLCDMYELHQTSTMAADCGLFLDKKCCP